MKKIKTLKLVVLMLLSLSLASCSSAVVLYPIEKTDFYVQDNGDICMSEFYFKEVLEAKIKKK